MTRRRKSRSGDKASGKKVGLYHEMLIHENFERCASRFFEILKDAQKLHPGCPRVLYFDVQGHRNDVGGYDHDADELMSHFIFEFIGPFITEFYTPRCHAKNRKAQRNDVPESLTVMPSPEKGEVYDVHTLQARPREATAVSRRSPPTVRAIADYLGLREPLCLICWGHPVDRAHALPKSLSGSYDVRNFALLCRRHHKEAPDVADAEAFWAWVDYASLRDSRERRSAVAGGTGMPGAGLARARADFNDDVRHELIELYGWREEDFAAMDWRLISEFNNVMAEATGNHFAVKRKASTYAWAYDIARKRISDP